MGRSFVKAILNSSRGLMPKDNSDQAMAARRINNFADLAGIEFLAKIDVGQDVNGEPKNEIKIAITPEHKDYESLMDNKQLTTNKPTWTNYRENKHSHIIDHKAPFDDDIPF